MPLCRAAWSKLQPFLSGRIAERLDPAVVGEASPVEHDPADTGLLAPGGDELAHLGGHGRRQGTLTPTGLLPCPPCGGPSRPRSGCPCPYRAPADGSAESRTPPGPPAPGRCPAPGCG